MYNWSFLWCFVVNSFNWFCCGNWKYRVTGFIVTIGLMLDIVDILLVWEASVGASTYFAKVVKFPTFIRDCLKMFVDIRTDFVLNASFYLN